MPGATAEPVADAGILVEDGAVLSFGGYKAVHRAYPLARERGARDLVAIPGLVDAHSHGRGMPLAVQGIEDGPLELFLARLTACTPLDPRDDALVAGADLLRTGVTAAQVFFHGFGNVASYRAGACATAAGLAEAGLEYELVLGITDRDEFVPPDASEIPEAARALASPGRGLDPPEFFQLFDALATEWGRTPTLGPVAPQWCSDELWSGVAARAAVGVRVHTHLLEGRAQRVADPVATLARFGVLGDGLSVAHGVWLDEAELALVAGSGATLVHCPGSNRRLGVGTAPIRRWLAAGATTALGLDSLPACEPPDAFVELRLARALSGLTAREALGLATAGGARALGRPDLGVLCEGAAANVVLLRAPEPRTETDLIETLLAKASRADVREVWVRGIPVLEDGRLRNEVEVEAARGRLRMQLQSDAEPRRHRLAAVAAAELWLTRVWALDPP